MIMVRQFPNRSIIVGPIAGIIMATAPIMPRFLDLAFMAAMFKHRGKTSGR